MTTGQRIKEVREKYGCSMARLSRLTKMPLRNIMLWESGQRNPPSYIYDYCALALQMNWNVSCKIGAEYRISKLLESDEIQHGDIQEDEI